MGFTLLKYPHALRLRDAKLNKSRLVNSQYMLSPIGTLRSATRYRSPWSTVAVALIWDQRTPRTSVVQCKCKHHHVGCKWVTSTEQNITQGKQPARTSVVFDDDGKHQWNLLFWFQHIMSTKRCFTTFKSFTMQSCRPSSTKCDFYLEWTQVKFLRSHISV